MKTKIIFLFFALSTQLTFSQITTNRVLKGQVRNDLAPIENVIVFDVNSKTGTLVNQYGYFTLMAKVQDTLVFSSLTFKSKKVILKEEDFINNVLVVNLEVFTNELSEVLILAKKQLNPIQGGTQKYVDMKFFDDEKSSPKIKAFQPLINMENGTDFVRIYKDIIKVLRKDNPKKTDFYKETSFSEVALSTVNYSFFSNTLALSDDEIKLFLVFCENDPKSRMVMNPNDQFKLMDFLITKNKEYKKITTI
jgi:pSer/pThr/pTyr-binding forkhead associated (FHA) protein